jgi:hypothetical protein
MIKGQLPPKQAQSFALDIARYYSFSIFNVRKMAGSKRVL